MNEPTYIEIIKEEIQQVADLFYQQKNVAGMSQMNILLSELSRFAEILFEKIQDGSVEFDIKRYVNVLSDAMNAMEVKDITLTADVLQYDLMELFDEFESIM